LPNAKRRLRLTGAEEAEYTATQLTIDENNTVANQINVAQKLRKRLPNARITSYTYCLHGVTSVTDPTGYTIYTEYDVFGRPLSEKDDEGNIIKKIQYNYGIN